jgi:hypothetical protein
MARKRETGRSALECEVVALDTIRPHPDNARIHPEENVEALASSLEAFGQVEPLVVQRSTRYVLGCSVHWVDMDDVRAASLSVALNRTAELAKWDDAVLARLLERFRTAAPDAGVPIVGFTEEQVNRVLTRFSPRQESGAVAEPSTVPVSQPVGQSGGDDPGGQSPAGGGPAPTMAPGPISSHVRMCQLFLDTETYPDFQDCIEKLQAFYGTANATTTVVEALRRERERIA